MQLIFLWGGFSEAGLGHLLGIQFLTNVGRLSPVIGKAEGRLKTISGSDHDGVRPLIGMDRLGYHGEGDPDYKNTIDWKRLHVRSFDSEQSADTENRVVQLGNE